MKKLLLLSCLFSNVFLFSKEYVLEFNNKKMDVKLNENTILKLNDNESINIILKEKEEQTYLSENNYIEFKYKNSNPPIFQKLNDEISQIVMLNNKTNQIIIQNYNFLIDKNLIYENILLTLKKDSNIDIKPIQTIVSRQIKDELLLGDSFIITEDNVETKYTFFYKQIEKNTLVVIESNVYNVKEPEEKDKGLNYNLFWQTLRISKD